ncbi:BLUF domain-containing protein [Ramlibacter tataouinensis]|uniref:BLUF domain-containing protein n=1 Tax=Ramlibacter tataouinensis TaxID=94132 RepID=UPI00131502DA|nr:BLUF domain-containing protein [Ramlibacter tataouinensis]
MTRIVCTSVSTVRGSVMEELFRVRDRICAQGAGTPVMGAMLYCAGWFVLWLEGPEEAVEAARQRAAEDPRNIHQQVIHRSRGPATLGVMATVVMAQVGGGPGPVWWRIQRLKDQTAPMQPLQIWQALSTPVAGAAAAAASRPSRTIALLAAEDNGPVHLLQNLCDRAGTTLAYLRYADSANLSGDAGLAYADIPAGGQLVRVKLLSRRSLRNELVRASLAGADELVLLLGSRAGASTGLASIVADCLKTLPSRPAIYLCGEPQAQVQAAIPALAGAEGLDPAELEGFIAGAAEPPWALPVSRPPAGHADRMEAERLAA